MQKAGELEVVLQEGSARLTNDDSRSFLVNTAIRLHNQLLESNFLSMMTLSTCVCLRYVC